MPFKDRLMKTFGKKSDTSSDGSSCSTPEYSYTGRTDIEYYKPHEIPKSKYRGRVSPEHKEQLESFCFNDAFGTMKRKPSEALSGIMSPGGTKSQSRRASYVSQASEDAESDSALETQQTTSSTSTSEEDTDSFDTDLSRETTLRPENFPTAASKIQLEGETEIPKRTVQYTELITPPNNEAFTTDELERAMTQITLRAGHSREARNSLAIAVH